MSYSTTRFALQDVLASVGLAAALAANTWYVCSATSGASTTDGGQTPDKPFSTIDSAINAASAGDLILVLPGHAETVTAAAGIDADKAGLKIIGVGDSERRPIVTFGTATGADLDVDAANILIKNIVFKNDIDSQTAMIDINAAGCVIEDCEFIEGSSKQALIFIDINGGAANACDRTTIRRCTFKSITAGAAEAIELGEVADRVLIEDCLIDGDWSDAGIHNPTGKVLTNLVIRNCIVRNRQTGDHAIELVSACTGEAVDNRLFADTPGIVFDPGSLFCSGNTETHKIDASGVPSPAGLSQSGWIHVAKAGAALPQSTAGAIFTVAGGRVAVMALIGQVGTAIQNQANNTKLIANPTSGTDVDLCAVLDIANDEAATLYGITGIFGDAMVGANAGATVAPQRPVVVAAGTIDLSCSASNTGTTKWDLWYLPLDSGARVVSA